MVISLLYRAHYFPTPLWDQENHVHTLGVGTRLAPRAANHTHYYSESNQFCSLKGPATNVVPRGTSLKYLSSVPGIYIYVHSN